MLELTSENFVNRGGMRHCYRHPELPGRCVKVYRPLSEVKQASKRKRIERGLQSRRYNVNVHEYEFWRELVENPVYGQLVRPYLPAMYGLVETNVGLGLDQEMLCTEDGSPAKNLHMIAATLELDEVRDLLLQFDELTGIVIEYALPIYDWNPQNLLIVRNDGRPCIRVADIEGEFGNKATINLSRFSSWFRRRKLRRRCERGRAFLEGLIADLEARCN